MIEFRDTMFPLESWTRDVLELRKDMSQVKTDLAVLKWMVGFSLASVIGGFAIVIRLLSR